MTRSLDPPGDAGPLGRLDPDAPASPVTPASPSSSAADAAFADLYRERYAAMVRLAHLITGSNAVAPDLVQDAFLKVAPRFATIEQPAAYLRTVVVNECRSWIRRQTVERKHQPTAQPAPSLPPDVDEMWAALTTLSERQRAALVLRYYEDLSLEDIARTLGCRLGTAKPLVHRGLASLKEVLAG